MLPREIFEILHAVMAILVLFAQFSRKLCFNFLTLILSTSPKYGGFCSHINIAANAQGVRLVVIKEVRNYGKFVFITNIVEKGW